MRRIILSRTDRIGDVVLTTATFGPLRIQFPDATIRILVRPELAALLAHEPGIQPLPCPSPSPSGAKGFHFQRFRKWRDYFRTNPADAIVFLHPDNDLQFAAAAARIPLRIGYARQAGRLALNDRLPYLRHLGQKHEAACNFDLLERLGCHPPEAPRPFLSLGGESTPSPQPGPYAIFHPAAHGDKPRWPAAHYARLAEMIVECTDWKIILIGATPCRETAAALEQRGIPRDRWEERGGQDSLPETAALLKHARIVVSRDSGPAHLAAAVGAPLVCLMGQCDPIHSPTRWAPIGPNVRTLISDLPAEKGESRADRWNRCFETISPEAVMEAVRDCAGLHRQRGAG